MKRHSEMRSMARLHTDIPTRSQVGRMMRSRARTTVSVYVPTDPASDNRAAALDLRNMADRAIHQLRIAEMPTEEIAAVEEQLADLVSDEGLLAASGPEPSPPSSLPVIPRRSGSRTI
jgi:hypothetical protein